MLDGICLLPALTFYHKFTEGADVASFSDIYNSDSGVIFAMVFASIGFLVRPLVVAEIHLTYYRKQLSEANKFNFLALTQFMPVLFSLTVLGLSTKTTQVEIPFTCLL